MSMRDTCTIFGDGTVDVAAIPNLVVVLGETIVIFYRSPFDSANFPSGFTCRRFS